MMMWTLRFSAQSTKGNLLAAKAGRRGGSWLFESEEAALTKGAWLLRDVAWKHDVIIHAESSSSPDGVEVARRARHLVDIILPCDAISAESIRDEVEAAWPAMMAHGLLRREDRRRVDEERVKTAVTRVALRLGGF